MTSRKPTAAAKPVPAPAPAPTNTPLTVPVTGTLVLREAEEVGMKRQADVCGSITVQGGMVDLSQLKAVVREDDMTICAGAYDIACEELEVWQAKRRRRGLPATTEGSLCDGMASILGYVEDLEARLGIKGTRRAPKPRLPSRPQPISDAQLLKLMRAAGMRFQTVQGFAVDSTAGAQQLDVVLRAARMIAAAAAGSASA